MSRTRAYHAFNYDVPNSPKMLAKKLAPKFLKEDSSTAPSKVQALSGMSEAKIKQLEDWCKCIVHRPAKKARA